MVNINIKRIIFLFSISLSMILTSSSANAVQQKFDIGCTKKFFTCGYIPKILSNGWNFEPKPPSKDNEIARGFNVANFSVSSEARKNIDFWAFKNNKINSIKKDQMTFQNILKSYNRKDTYEVIENNEEQLLIKYYTYDQSGLYRHYDKNIYKNGILSEISFSMPFNWADPIESELLFFLKSFKIIASDIEVLDLGSENTDFLRPNLGIFGIPVSSLNLPFDIQRKMGIIPDKGTLVLGVLKGADPNTSKIKIGDIIQSAKREFNDQPINFENIPIEDVNTNIGLSIIRNRTAIQLSIKPILQANSTSENDSHYHLDLGQQLVFNIDKNFFDPNTPNLQKIFPDNFLCNVALNIDGTEVDKSKRLAPFVSEAERRHLSLNDCRSSLDLISKDQNDLNKIFSDNGSNTIDSEYSKISINSENAGSINLKIAELKAQIEVLNSIISEQTKLKDEANDLSSSIFEKSIQSARYQLLKLEKKYSAFDQSFSNYLTSIKPNDAKNYLTARKASEIYPKIPYYIPGTPEEGEFWIEPFVSDIGELKYNLKFIDPKDSIEKVRAQISMSQAQLEETKKALFKLYNWSELAHQNKLRKSFEKRVSCFPETECAADQESLDGKTSTEVRFLIYEDGSTGGRIQRNKGKFSEGYNFSIDSALLLQACISHIMNYANQEFEGGKQNSKSLDAMFQ